MPAIPTPSQFDGNSIFWIDVDKIKPNPYQPRRDFDEARLRDLSESIRMYGVLQPLTVTRHEVVKEDGGLAVEYELIAGERRLRASKLAGVSQVPALIRANTDDARLKLELAIIENLQREDLNPVDRARAFERLSSEFKFTHAQIGAKMGKSREYVSNTLRLLGLPPEILEALGLGQISEGHTRPLLMLSERKDEQMTLFKEIMFKKITVREAEGIARRIAYDRARKKENMIDPEIIELEEKLTESLGTRVQIERKDQKSGKIHIDFFSNDDLRMILDLVKSNQAKKAGELMEKFQAGQGNQAGEIAAVASAAKTPEAALAEGASVVPADEQIVQAGMDDRSKEEKEMPEDPGMYSVANFSL